MNGDWFTYLLILIFFVFPLIQQLLEAARRGKAPPPTADEETSEEDWRAVRLPRPDPPEQQEEVVVRRPGGGWSDGWGAWPGEIATSEPEAETTREPIATLPESNKYEPWMAERPDRVPEPEPAERPRVFTYDDPDPEVIESVRPRSIAAPPLRDRVTSRGRQLEALAALRSRGDLREAIVLTEVLGRPKALRLDPTDDLGT